MRCSHTDTLSRHGKLLKWRQPSRQAHPIAHHQATAHITSASCPAPAPAPNCGHTSPSLSPHQPAPTLSSPPHPALLTARRKQTVRPEAQSPSRAAWGVGPGATARPLWGEHRGLGTSMVHSGVRALPCLYPQHRGHEPWGGATEQELPAGPARLCPSCVAWQVPLASLCLSFLN